MVTPHVRNVAHALLDAYGRADDSHHALEAELDALNGNSSTFVLLAVQRERRNARPPFVAPRDPGLVLARRSVAPASSPAVEQRGARPVPPRAGRLTSLLLCVAVVAVPLAAGIYLPLILGVVA